MIRSRRPWAAAQVATGQRRDRLVGREPRREADHADDHGVVGDVHRRAGAHRVAEEHDGHLAELAAYLLERPARVLDRPGPAVPAAVPVAQQPGRRPRPRAGAGAIARCRARQRRQDALRPSTACSDVCLPPCSTRTSPRRSSGASSARQGRGGQVVSRVVGSAATAGGSEAPACQMGVGRTCRRHRARCPHERTPAGTGRGP